MEHGAEHTKRKERKTPVKIGIKYCDGCNPCYERAEIVKTLAEDIPEAEIVSASPGCEVDHVAVICGCTRACASHEEMNGRGGKTVVTAREGYQSLIENIMKIFSNGIKQKGA